MPHHSAALVGALRQAVDKLVIRMSADPFVFSSSPSSQDEAIIDAVVTLVSLKCVFAPDDATAAGAAAAVYSPGGDGTSGVGLHVHVPPSAATGGTFEQQGHASSRFVYTYAEYRIRTVGLLNWSAIDFCPVSMNFIGCVFECILLSWPFWRNARKWPVATCCFVFCVRMCACTYMHNKQSNWDLRNCPGVPMANMHNLSHTTLSLGGKIPLMFLYDLSHK